MRYVYIIAHNHSILKQCLHDFKDGCLYEAFLKNNKITVMYGNELLFTVIGLVIHQGDDLGGYIMWPKDEIKIDEDFFTRVEIKKEIEKKNKGAKVKWMKI